MFEDETLLMWEKALGTVVMDYVFVEGLFASFGVNGAAAHEGFSLDPIQPVIVETKMGAGAEVAVEVVHRVAPFVLGIEGTKIGFMNDHVVVSEIGDDLFVAEVGEFA
jgi:hypothetical protein